MTSYDTAYLLYLGLLLAAIGGSLIVANRRRLGTLARNAALWALIFIGAIASYGLWSDIRQEIMPRQAIWTDGTRIEVPRARDGHYYVTALVDGAPIEFVIDTGATAIVLTLEDAARAGIDTSRLAFTGIASTANGTVRTARARVREFKLGPVTHRNVWVRVSEGEMPGSLLGMSYLQRFSKIEISGGRLILTP
jgi:aspartyl protease family protein